MRLTLQDRLVQLRIRQEPLQPGVLFLQVFQTPRLVDLQPAYSLRHL